MQLTRQIKRKMPDDRRQGLGIDIEAIDRFAKISRRKDRHFLNRLFTPQELRYCFLKQDPAPHLAARFAAKEATVKAFGSLGLPIVDLKRIAVLLHRNGAPHLVVSDYPMFTATVSLSHGAGVAVAAVLVTTNTL